MLRTRKSIGMGKGSGSDDDFKPIKAAALKRKPTEKKAVPKRKTAQKIVDVKDEDEDMYVAPSPKTKTDVKKKAPAVSPKRKR